MVVHEGGDGGGMDGVCMDCIRGVGGRRFGREEVGGRRFGREEDGG